MTLVQTFEEIATQGEAKLLHWKSLFFSMLPNLIVAVLIVSFFVFMAGFLKGLSKKLFRRVTRNELVVSFLSKVVFVSCTIVGLISALGILHLDKTVTSILAGAGILGLAISFAFQDIVANFISGVLIAFYKPFEVGHRVKTKDYSGRVHTINLRNTVLDSVEGERVLIPNKDIVQNPLVNFSVSGSQRATLNVKTPVDLDLNELRRKVRSALESVEGVDTKRGPDVHFVKHESGLLHFVVSYWLSVAGHPSSAALRTETQMTLIRQLRAQGIELA